MPTVSFYLRNEDYDKWRALKKPGEFIHNALNGLVVAGVQEATLKDAMIPVKPIKRSEAPTIPKEEPFKTYFKKSGR